MIFYIYFQLERLLYFSAFFDIHIFAIYLNRNIYVHTFENKHISYLFLFSIARALMLRFTIAKHLEQLFFWNDLCYGNKLWEKKWGGKKINFKLTDTVPCIKLK